MTGCVILRLTPQPLRHNMATETLTLLQREAFEKQFLRKHSSTIVCSGRSRSLEQVPRMPTILGECSSNIGDRKAPPTAQVSEALEKLVARIKASHSAAAKQPSKRLKLVDVPVNSKANGQLTATNPPKVNAKENRICKKRPKPSPLMANSSRLYESMKARRH